MCQETDDVNGTLIRDLPRGHNISYNINGSVLAILFKHLCLPMCSRFCIYFLPLYLRTCTCSCIHTLLCHCIHVEYLCVSCCIYALVFLATLFTKSVFVFYSFSCLQLYSHTCICHCIHLLVFAVVFTCLSSLQSGSRGRLKVNTSPNTLCKSRQGG